MVCGSGIVNPLFKIPSTSLTSIFAVSSSTIGSRCSTTTDCPFSSVCNGGYCACPPGMTVGHGGAIIDSRIHSSLIILQEKVDVQKWLHNKGIIEIIIGTIGCFRGLVLLLAHQSRLLQRQPPQPQPEQQLLQVQQLLLLHRLLVPIIFKTFDQ